MDSRAKFSQITRTQNATDMKGRKDEKTDLSHRLHQNSSCDFWRCEQSQPILHIFLGLDKAIHFTCYLLLRCGGQSRGQNRQ